MLSDKSGIETRYSVINDFSVNPKAFKFFAKNPLLEPEPDLTSRMKVYRKEALTLSLNAVNNIQHFEKVKPKITHLITVTCTGLFAPGLDIELIHELGLSSSTQRSSVNFMGCNAAIIAMNSAFSICSSMPKAHVLIVCTELCTLHFQKIYNDDYILSTSLFGDGSAAILITTEKPKEPYFKGLKIESFYSQIIHKGFNDMAWQLSEKGFIMNLSSYVSELINGNMLPLLRKMNINTEKIDLWAIHPGGKKILDDFAKNMNLTHGELKPAYEILRNFGNMSSATILFVLKLIIESNPNPKKGTNLFSAAFGPGLSIETMQLKYV